MHKISLGDKSDGLVPVFNVPLGAVFGQGEPGGKKEQQGRPIGPGILPGKTVVFPGRVHCGEIVELVTLAC